MIGRLFEPQSNLDLNALPLKIKLSSTASTSLKKIAINPAANNVIQTANSFNIQEIDNCMKFFSNLSVKTRLIAIVGIMLAMLAGVVTYSVISAKSSLNHVNGILQEELVKYELTAAIDSLTKSNARNTLELFIVGPDQQQVIRKRMGETRLKIDGLMKSLDVLIVKPEGRALFNSITAKRTAFVTAFTAVSQSMEKGNSADVQNAMVTQVLPALDALQAPISQLLEFQENLAHQRGESVEAALQLQIYVGLAAGVLALVIGIGLSLLLLRSILGPLQQAKEVATQIGKGNLAVEFNIEGKNELSDMLLSLHHMKEALAHVVMRMQESANQVAIASSEIAAANMDLSARTEAQASSLEETAAAMEQMSSTVQQNASSTESASKLSAKATVAAEDVGVMVGNVVSTMRDIHGSSQRIQEIIGVIDSIAFQTNILALNAAVEAARAGDQGRGFAVVAGEVRLLAQRSASAAQEIKAIISENSTKMEMGNSRASQAGASVSQAVGAIEMVNETVAGVALATREQAIGIQQVGQAVNQLDEATQQNAALVEETAAATKNLDDQVQALKATINRFNIGGRTTAAFLPA